MPISIASQDQSMSLSRTTASSRGHSRPLRDADDDHYQILVRAAGSSSAIRVNVKSASTNAPSNGSVQTITAPTT